MVLWRPTGHRTDTAAEADCRLQLASSRCVSPSVADPTLCLVGAPVSVPRCRRSRVGSVDGGGLLLTVRGSQVSYFPRLFSGSHDSSGSALGSIQRHKCASMQSCDEGRKDGRVLTLLLTGSWGRGKTCSALFCSSCCWLRHTGCQVCRDKEVVCGLTGMIWLFQCAMWA